MADRAEVRTPLLGLDFDAVTEEEVIARVMAALEQGRGGLIATVNLEILRVCSRSSMAAQLVRQADMVLADGQPIVWACRLQGTPVPQRVAGSTLMGTLAAAAAENGRSIFLLGGETAEVAHRAAEALRAQHPDLRIAGWYSPPFGFERSADELERIRAAVERSRPDLVYAGLGFPKQERLIAELRPAFPETWFLGVGIGIGFIAGQVRRAPVWVQKLGFEWLHRLAQEPRRLGKRYLVHGPRFAARLLGVALATRVRKTLRP